MSDTAPFNEKVLVEQFAEGNEAAFRTLFDHYKDKVYSLSMYLTRSEIIAEEITQDVFLKLWLKREELKGVVYFNAYLRTVARNVAINYLRRMVQEQLILSKIKQAGDGTSGGTTADTVAFREYERLLNQVILRLPPQQKTAYLLSRQEGLTYEEIAGRMGLSVHTVKEYIKKALQTIRVFIETHIGILVFISASCFLA
jgi:RNA polymerase sigma-70 factor (ECF subfamily)